MDNLPSEVPFYIPELEYGDTWSETESSEDYSFEYYIYSSEEEEQQEEEEQSALDENPDDEHNFKTESFTYVAFRFRRVSFLSTAIS